MAEMTEEDMERLLVPICPGDPRRSPDHYEMSDNSVADRYLVMQGIGTGKYGKVYEGRDMVQGGLPVAIKVMPRSPHIDQKKAEREWVIASKLDHPNVIRLCDVQLSPTHTFLVLELASGRALYDTVSKEGGLDEDRARRIAYQIFVGIDYCHRRGVSHRDLKLENLLLMSPAEGDGLDGYNDMIKITDFGLSKDSLTSNCKTLCGTLSYMAPEVASADGAMHYEGPGVDIWSLGVILYVMVCCSYPFGHDGDSPGADAPIKVFQRIKVGQFKNPAEFAQRCSKDLQSLIRGMLAVDPASRFGFAEIHAHPWMQPAVQAAQAEAEAAAAGAAAQAAGGVTPGPEGGAEGAAAGLPPRLPPAVEPPQDGSGDGKGAGGLEEGLTVVWTPIDEELRHAPSDPDGVDGIGMHGIGVIPGSFDIGGGAAAGSYHDFDDDDGGGLDSMDSLGMLDSDDTGFIDAAPLSCGDDTLAMALSDGTDGTGAGRGTEASSSGSGSGSNMEESGRGTPPLPKTPSPPLVMATGAEDDTGPLSSGMKSMTLAGGEEALG